MQKIKKKFHVSTCGINSNDLAVKNLNKHYFLNYKKKPDLFFLVVSKIPIGFFKKLFFCKNTLLKITLHEALHYIKLYYQISIFFIKI